MHTRRTRSKIVAAAVLLVTAGALIDMAWSQGTPAPGVNAPPAPSRPCREVVAEIRVMAAETAALDQALEQRLDDVRAATPEERLVAMEALLEEMVLQRKRMRDLMKGAHQQMVHHVLEHVMTDGADVRTCPIMQQLRSEDRPGTSGASPELPPY